MAEHELEKLLGAFAADTLTQEERQQLYQAALRDQQLFDALADEQALKELLTDPAVRRRLLHALNETSPATGGSTASWLDWFRRPANLALAGGLATAVFAVILGTKVYQDSLKQAGRSVATEDAKPAAPPAPTPAATAPEPSRPIEPKAAAPETPVPTAAKKDGLTDKPTTSDRVAQSQSSHAADATLEYAPERIRRDDDRKQAEAPLATAGHERDVSARTDQQPAAGSPAAAPEPKKSLAPAASSLPEAGSSPAGARALFYGEAVRADTDGIAPAQERALKPSAESDSQANAFKRKLEGLSQLSKAASPAAPMTAASPHQPAACTASTSAAESMVPPPTSASCGAMRTMVAIACSAPGRFSGTSTMRKPASNSACATSAARSGSRPRRIATSGRSGIGASLSMF